ncbi:MAG: D-alanyl-D-alanine dipeptidase [Planctomycetota bacterium]|jgi:D-alanyl-D-alanine dipeptidase
MRRISQLVLLLSLIGACASVGGPRQFPGLGPRPAECPEELRPFLGEYGVYGEGESGLLVYEDGGRLQVVLPDGEHALLDELGLEFLHDMDGRVAVVLLGDRFLTRRRMLDEGDNFRIEPVQPVGELRAMAMAATPPVEEGVLRESDLVEVLAEDRRLHLNIRYAGRDNFMGSPFYEEGRAYLQRSAAEALIRVHDQLLEHGYGLLIYDGYRPWHVTRMFWDGVPELYRDFVADPSRGSRHNRGCAVDLTLCHPVNGKPVSMVSGFDEFEALASPDYPGGTSLQRWHRDLLRTAMEAEGFQVYRNEWWHFDYDGWEQYPLLNKRFVEIYWPYSDSF